MSVERTTPVAMTIAGSDSGGGAGIQADLKAFAAAGVHGTSAIVALTAQNTLGVEAIHAVPPEIIRAQIEAVASDIGVDAAKTGMLGDEATIEAVAGSHAAIADAPLVVDPVMVAESGAVLLDAGSKRALIERILPLAAVATPNLPEARELSGLGEDASPEELARAVQALGPDAVVVTGGHGAEHFDLFFDGDEAVAIEGPWHEGGAAHGSGCTHSATLAAMLAKGASPLEAARVAREVAAAAVGAGLRDIGAGPGPVDVLAIIER
jgi:hydroxymethylpyrimidine/phosphomethylpyrimidine kinase